MRAKEISVGCFTVGRCRGNCQHSKNITVTSVCCPHVTANMERKQLCCIPPSILLLNVHANARSTRYANGVLLEGQAELGKNSEGQRLRARLSAGLQRRNECANKKGVTAGLSGPCPASTSSKSHLPRSASFRHSLSGSSSHPIAIGETKICVQHHPSAIHVVDYNPGGTS